MEINKTTLTIAAGVAGTLFLGYCIYFDKKRRSDPDYKKKIRERKFFVGTVWKNDGENVFLNIDCKNWRFWIN